MQCTVNTPSQRNTYRRPGHYQHQRAHGTLPRAHTPHQLGPVVVNYMREYQLGLGLPREQVYNQTMYILTGMLVVGLVCNLLVRPLAGKWFMTDAELAAEKRLAHERATAVELVRGVGAGQGAVSPLVLVMAWAAVGIPLAWGIYRTLQSVAKFFG